MRKSRSFKIILFAVLTAFLLEAGVMAYSAVINRSGGKSSGWQVLSKLFAAAGTSASTSSTAVTTAGTDGSSAITAGSIDSAAADVSVPTDILQLIRAADPSAYDKNVANYRKLLADLYVDKQYQGEMEGMIRKGKKLPYILVAYRFVSDSYGTMDEVKKLVDERTSGKTWAAVFEEYRKNNPDFVPQSFDSDYLDKLSNTEGITKDDIMIADRVSQKLSLPFSEIMQKRLSGQSWKEINAGYGIVNGQSELPQVPVAPDKAKKLAQSSGLTEEKVIQAYVMAYKLDSDVQTIIGKIKSGYTKTRIYAECLEARYE